MHEFSVYSPAKLNLYLDVLGKRPDGYHDIETIFEKIDIKDEIIIKERPKGLRVTVEPRNVCPDGEGNIVFRAISALLEEAGVAIGLEVLVRKKIPVSAGLGGGSSNAASVLRSLNERFGLGVESERLFSLANGLGKDSPFFMNDHSFAIGKHAGDRLEEIDTDSSLFHVVIKPGISISTREMYKKVDLRDRKKEGLDIGKTVSALKNRDIRLLRESCYNVFEQALGDKKALIERTKALFEETGAGPGFLSGSGPSVFCILDTREEAMAVAERVPKGAGFEVFVGATHKGGIYGDH